MDPAHTEYIADKCDCLLEVKRFYLGHCNSMVVISLHRLYILSGVRAEATADNTSIRVSWQWSCQGVLDLVRVDYQPEGGS